MSSEEDITADEAENIIKAFKSLKLKPKADTPEDFQHWLTTATMPVIQKEPDAIPSTSAKEYPGFPRISTFTGSPK